ncbi:MAG: hypothetical protein Q8K63_09375, partial [Acidimicrobiales bacterium]|nr:hypothetical protein [Acidimicrobiales bacterium]
MFRPVVYFATNHDWRGYQHFYQGLAKAFSETRPLLYVGGVTTGSGRFDHVAENIWLLNARVPNGTGRASLRPIRDQILARATRRATT